MYIHIYKISVLKIELHFSSLKNITGKYSIDIKKTTKFYFECIELNISSLVLVCINKYYIK